MQTDRQYPPQTSFLHIPCLICQYMIRHKFWKWHWSAGHCSLSIQRKIIQGIYFRLNDWFSTFPTMFEFLTWNLENTNKSSDIFFQGVCLFEEQNFHHILRIWGLLHSGVLYSMSTNCLFLVILLGHPIHIGLNLAFNIQFSFITGKGHLYPVIKLGC